MALVTVENLRVEPQELRRQVAAAAAALPGTGELLNLCEDRQNFIVMFAAALARHRTVLLPPSHAPAAVAELRARHPGCEVVDDEFAAVIGDAPDAAAGSTQAAADFVAAIGHTSGSTGVPAAHSKSLRSLERTTALNAGVLRAELARQAEAGRPWIVATVPPQHMYGLETSVLLPLLSGFGVHAGRPLMPADVAAALAAVPAPRVLVSTPVHLRALVESGAGYPKVAVVISATAPLSRELASSVEGRFGATLVEFFGSTETCVIATRRTAHEDGWRPHPGIRLEPGEEGTTVTAPWLPRPERLHDVVELRDDGTFVVVGRGRDFIDVAGKRASLADLTRRLQSLPGVEDAVVFQPPAGGGGARRCAALVVAPGRTARELLEGLRGQFDPVFLPRPLLLVPKLPRNEVGKLSRERLLEALATSTLRPRPGK
jgi:acyl-coenzyme A synthetase/AMP-(fatty) acid ligase